MSSNRKNNPRISEIYCVVAVLAGFIIVFLVGNSGFPVLSKLLIALTAFFIFVLLPIIALARMTRESDREAFPKAEISDAALAEEFETLEEAAVFFSASLKSGEMFRLLKSRLERIFPMIRFVFFAADGDGSLKRSAAGSPRAEDPDGGFSALTDLAYKSHASGKKVFNKDLKRMFDGDPLSYRMAAVPLKRGDEVFCVLAVYCSEDSVLPDEEMLNTIAVRLTPLIAGSLSFESSVSNAFTDMLTQLPNERAMYLILENQVAEAQRFGRSRPLSVVAIDLDSFDEINSKYGHSEGDRVLSFAGSLIKGQLRKMDFLARTSDDEFFIILPTAGESASEQVLKRVVEAFDTNPYRHGDGTSTRLKLNFGRAGFDKNTDSASKLLRVAIENKQLDKPSGGSVLRFPTN